jgi:hypothetical protein
MTNIKQNIIEKDVIVDKRVTMLQYINTGILSLILGIATMISVQLSHIKEDQSVMQAELLRLKTVQDINVANVSTLSGKVQALEIGYAQDLKNWVDLNYVRKPQK